VKDRSYAYSKGPGAIPALPTRSPAITAGMAAYSVASAIRANRPPMPAYLLQILYSLFLGLKVLKEL
jgi:hypothetical protein